jgi:hypothetical protein
MGYRIIADNGGGITLQIDARWAHYYDGQPGNDAKAVVRDVLAYESNGLDDTWDGNEPEAMECNPTPDEIRNGGYRVYTSLEDIAERSGWANVDAMIEAVNA